MKYNTLFFRKLVNMSQKVSFAVLSFQGSFYNLLVVLPSIGQKKSPEQETDALISRHITQPKSTFLLSSICLNRVGHSGKSATNFPYASSGLLNGAFWHMYIVLRVMLLITRAQSARTMDNSVESTSVVHRRSTFHGL